MAATARRALIALKWAAIALIGALALFVLAGWIGSSIARNGDWQEPASGVTIMVETNGVHTALVVPLVTPEKDWRADFPASDLPQGQRPYTHLSVSWGERDVFLNTPTWADLRFMTVLRIAGLGGDGLLHVAHYVRPAPSADARALVLTPGQYRRLVRQIEAAMPRAPVGRRAVYPGYTGYDVFYDAPGRYTVTNTCNQWTSNVLAAAGVRTGWWTPFAGGVMKWVPPPEPVS